MNMKIFVDLDGVLVDFVVPAMCKFGADISSELEYPVGCGWSIVKATNIVRERKGLNPITDKEFWNGLDYRFWCDLRMYTASLSLLGWLETKGEVYLATSPTLSPSCVAGKYSWVMNWLPEYRRRLFIGTSKEAFAGPDSILIDDRDKNCDRFREAGGKAVLVPRPWNLAGFDSRPLTHTIVKVKEICN
jgi:5'(3')-deoxyribonucleotidase